MHYSAMTLDQQAQAAQLFCDAFFGVDPRGYEYELDRAGQITGRVSLPAAPASRSPRLSSVTSGYHLVPGDPLVIDCCLRSLARAAMSIPVSTNQGVQHDGSTVHSTF